MILLFTAALAAFCVCYVWVWPVAMARVVDSRPPEVPKAVVPFAMLCLTVIFPVFAAACLVVGLTFLARGRITAKQFVELDY